MYLIYIYIYIFMYEELTLGRQRLGWLEIAQSKVDIA